MRHGGRTRWAFAILAGVAFGMQALIIHVQVVLMSALAFTAYVGFRMATGPHAPRPVASPPPSSAGVWAPARGG